MRRVRRMGVMARGGQEALILLQEDELRRDSARGPAACFCNGRCAGRRLRDAGHSARSKSNRCASGEDGQFPRDTTEK